MSEGHEVISAAETEKGAPEKDFDTKKEKQNIIDFLDGKNGSSLFDLEEDKTQRESSVMSAIFKVAKENPDLEPLDIYKMLYPEKSEQLLDMNSKDFWDNFDELQKSTPDSLMQFKLLQELKADVSLFEKNVKKFEKSFSNREFVYQMYKQSPISTIYFVSKWKSQPFAKELCMKMVNDDLFMGMFDSGSKLLVSIRNETYAKEIYLSDLPKNPRSYLDIYPIYTDKEYADEILEKSIRTLVSGSGIGVLSSVIEHYNLFHNKPYANEVMNTIRERETSFGETISMGMEKQISEMKILTQYYESSNISERVNYITGVVEKINPNFQTQLNAFNKKNGVALKLMGVKDTLPLHYIFINTWQNPNDSLKLPLRIPLTEMDISEYFEDNLQAFLDFEKRTNREQIEIWTKRGYNFDIPRDGKTSFMITAVPKDLLGTETDGLEMGKIFSKRYGANWQSVLMENKQEWGRIKPQSEEVPENIEPTKENILSELENGLKRAIDSSQERFSFYYLMHGSPDGTMGAIDETFSAQEFAEIFSKEHNGQSIASQIEIDIIAESCFSGSQLQVVIQELEKRKISVKGLHIITAVSHEKPAEGGLEPRKASLVGSEAMNDRSGAMAYYISYYFEMIDYLKSQGQDIQPPLDTMGHAIAFADRMAREDSHTQQDLQAYYYSTMDKNMAEPEKVKGAISKKETTVPGVSAIGPDKDDKKPSTKIENQDVPPSGYYISRNESESQNEAFT